MERFGYWIKRIIEGKWKQCRSFCVRCEYYYECMSDSMSDSNDYKKHIKNALKLAGYPKKRGDKEEK